MAKIDKIVFREMTASDFYWINQSGSGGGGRQSYFDFNTSDVTPADWVAFFKGTPATSGTLKGGPFWEFDVRSLGTTKVQTDVKLGQRRASSYSLRNQKLPAHSTKGNRLHAWRPENGFPALPANVTSAGQVPAALIAGLRIFMIRDDNGEFWAGWLRQAPPGLTDPKLRQLLEEHSGMINLAGAYTLDLSQPHWPFGNSQVGLSSSTKSPLVTPTSTALSGPAGTQNASGSIEGDPDWDDLDELPQEEPGITYAMKTIRKRNRGAAKSLKKMYSECQITGSDFLFVTKNGLPYLEVHHLVPLGAGGADSPYNMVVLSAHAHKMLHYAPVEGLDLGKIKNDRLNFSLNGEPATITWHPKHAEIVAKKIGS